MAPGAGQISTVFYGGDRPGVTCEFSQNYNGGIPQKLVCEWKNEYETQKEPLFPRFLIPGDDGSFAKLFYFRPSKHPQNGVFSVCFTFLRKDVKQ